MASRDQEQVSMQRRFPNKFLFTPLSLILSNYLFLQALLLALIMASTLQQFRKLIMIEKQTINGKDIWFQIEPYHVQRSSPDIIPTEYFTAKYYFQEPSASNNGEIIKDEDGETKLFESPVAALTYASKKFTSRS